MGTIAITLAALAIRYVLHPYIQPFAAFHFFTVNSVVIECLFGYKFAIISMIFGALLGEYFFVFPYEVFDGLARKDIIILINYLFVTSVVIGFLEKLLRTAYSHQLLMNVVESRHKLSLQRENDRLYYARKSSEASIILENKLNNFEQIFLIKNGENNYKVGPMFYRVTGQIHPTFDAEDWTWAVHPDDVESLEQHLTSPKNNKLSSIRVIRADGQFQKYETLTDHYKSADEGVAVLRIVGNTDSEHPIP